MHQAAQPANETEISNLLDAIIEEMHLLACEIVLLGDRLTADGARASVVDNSKYLQSFDMLSQRAFANVQLLQTWRDCAGGMSAPVGEIVGAVPFHEIRERLFQKIQGGAGGGDVPALPGSEVELF